MARVLHLFNVLGAATERFTLQTALALAGEGYAPTLACEALAPEAPDGLPDPVLLQRVAVGPTDDPAAQMRDVAQAVGDPAWSALLAEPFDLIHGHFGTRVLHAAPWIQRGTPTVIGVYGYDASRLLRDPAWVGRYRWAADQGVLFVSVSPQLCQRLVDHGIPSDRVAWAPMGLDLNDWPFDPTPAPPAPLFVFVGRLTEKKDPIGLVEAFARLNHRLPDAHLRLVGGGPLSAAVEQRVADLGLERSVSAVGPVAPEGIADQLAGATAMVLPSAVAPDGDEEGMPRVLVEAQALGVPCVTTDHAGNPLAIPEAWRDELVVPERDPAALAEAMGCVAAMSPAKRTQLQEAARHWVVEHHAMGVFAAAHVAWYRRLGVEP